MKPVAILHGVEDRPPFHVALLNALQHAAVITSVGLVFPLLVLDAAKSPPEESIRVLSVSLVALACATLLLCHKGRLIGSGYLAPAVFTAAYLPPSIMAAKLGGLPMVFGMTVFAGLCEIGMALILRRMRAFLPIEIAGLAVTMIGITLGVLGFRLILGATLSGTPSISPTATMVGVVTLVVMVALSVWGSGTARMLCVLWGIIIGYAVSALTGVLDSSRLAAGLDHGFVYLPRPSFSLPILEPSLLIPFTVGALAAALRAMGDVITCQKINDPRWAHPDYRSIRGALLGDGLGTVAAGGLGTVGLNTFSACIGLSAATGITARSIAWFIAAILLVLALLPQPLGLLAATPKPIMGATLLFSAAFIIINGLQIVFSRLLDNRKILTIGLGLIAGICHDIYSNLFGHLPGMLASFGSSALVSSLAAATVLNLLFRIGARRRAAVSVTPDQAGLERLLDFVDGLGGQWGARRDVMSAVRQAAIEGVELARASAMPGAAIRVALAFDEYRIDMAIDYEGKAVPVAGSPTAASPTAAEIVEGEDGVARLGIFMLRRLASDVRFESGPDTQRIRLGFEH